MAIKFLGFIITFYLLVVLEAYGQNFYPTRYGKRDENGESARYIKAGGVNSSRTAVKLKELHVSEAIEFHTPAFNFFAPDSYQQNRRIGRSENQDTFNRKMGFLISGGRFGKRGCTENCFEGDTKSGSKEIISSGYQNRQDRSERIRIPIRKNQFMVGSRFGKRMEGQIGAPDLAENVNTRNLKCVFLDIGDLYKCLERRQFSDEADSIDSNSNFEFIQ